MDREQLVRKRIAVIGGGWSDEREISLSSARECQRALLAAGFESVDLLDLAAPDFVGQVMGGYDVAFVALHGRFGEDGSVQGLLDVLHIPYTFSAVAASAVASEKELAKAVFRQAGIPVPEGVELCAGEIPDDAQLDELVSRLGLPLFVKPSANGSSYGVTRVSERAGLVPAIEVAGAGGSRVLVEGCVEGTEITVPVIGNDDDARALPVVEIVTGAEFYDLKVKYEPSELHHVIPARLAPDVYARAQELAVRAHRALGCRGCSRSDFIVRPDGTPTILETNTIPGMTSESLLPDSARHDGIEFPELCLRFVELALEGVAEGR